MNNTIPPASVLYAETNHYQYIDAYTIPLSRADIKIEALIPAFFQAAPIWVDKLFILRNQIVSTLGLKTEQENSRDLTPPFLVGRKIGLFNILAIHEAEILLGEDDQHLDFRTSLLLLRDEARQILVISSAVRTKNHLGKVYFALVKPIHRLIVPIVAKAMANRLNTP